MQKQVLTIDGPAGNIEAILNLPDLVDQSKVAVVCHPDPLQSGTMDNKVVTTVAKSFNQLNIPCVRFNYRGVGNSSGVYGDVVGEVADCLAVVAWAKQQYPQAHLYLAGFSFGAYIAADAATKVPVTYLLSIAPSIDRMPYNALPHISCPWVVIQGEDDDVVDPNSVYNWFAQLDANKTLIKFPSTGHFFHGKLLELQQQIVATLES